MLDGLTKRLREGRVSDVGWVNKAAIREGRVSDVGWVNKAA